MAGIIRKLCPFCREPLTKSNATNEHVIPQWLLREFGIADETISPVKWQRGKAPSWRVHQWSRLVVGCVCASCNSGWLSNLENAVKPLIPSIASGERRVASLTDAESLVLARWAAKTTFLCQLTAGLPSIIPVDAFCALRDAPDGLTKGTYVFGFQDGRNYPVAINALQTQDWTLYAPYHHALDIRASARTACKISLRVGCLHLLVAYFGTSGLEPVGWHRVHHPLFPSSCRLWIDAGFKIDRVTERQESSMVLFHVTLGAALPMRP